MSSPDGLEGAIPRSNSPSFWSYALVLPACTGAAQAATRADERLPLGSLRRRGPCSSSGELCLDHGAHRAEIHLARVFGFQLAHDTAHVAD